MNRVFYVVASSQFLSSLADNALLIASIALLVQMSEPGWFSPALKIFFVVPYVIFAPFVGAFADSRPKGQVMLVSNILKTGGCILIVFGLHPLLGYGIVGIGAALYAPAKYGILVELLPSDKLVAANGWMEGLIIAAIIFGALLGGFLISDTLNQSLVKFTPELLQTGSYGLTEIAICFIACLYLLAAFLNLPIFNVGLTFNKLKLDYKFLLKEFAVCLTALSRDHLGKLSLMVTALFWGAGATLQFIMLKWAQYALHMNLAESAALQAVSAIGVAAGAVYAACTVSLKSSTKVLPYGAMMGFVVCAMSIYHDGLLPPTVIFSLPSIALTLNHLPAYILLMLLGYLSGYFVVPMNALLQSRGYALMSTGQSIAAQGFCENIAVLLMLLIYSALLWFDVSLPLIILGFGGSVTVLTLLIMYQYFRLGKRAVDPIENQIA
ncbi:lysophospholipid transporter LplT [Polynucleobacter sp. AP-Sving-400A-A2]|uniref:lysophospholipid transporter LplT n=1 Tax=Polynucleobacter sp. AP-Sving-400A-A2 TaxID=2081049 RepID=UPI001BFD368A|nr:lysophospholipid transporter LplT [Polynucleobacter sp. AP-Sving-400A-A2]QWE14221.1 lysophospholipid transporter LplT [Polynucleobacter sp. AP-Sving-400A-A2]